MNTDFLFYQTKGGLLRGISDPRQQAYFRLGWPDELAQPGTRSAISLIVPRLPSVNGQHCWHISLTKVMLHAGRERSVKRAGEGGGQYLDSHLPPEIHSTAPPPKPSRGC